MNESAQVFISFKNLDPEGRQTRDSQLAQEVHDFLAAQGLRVFFSNVSLEKLGIAAYKKAIDDALDAVQILIAVGTSGENLDSQWVRYEWDSFFNDILSGVKPEGRVFVYVEGASISSLPRTLRQSQVFPHGPGAMDRLYNFIANALGRDSLDIDSKLAEVTERLSEMMRRDDAWRIGVVDTWFAEDSGKYISRIAHADWKNVTPASCDELAEHGWPGRYNGKRDQPKVWAEVSGEESLGTIAEGIFTVHRILYPTDPLGKLILTAIAPPHFETPPWFDGCAPGGELEITCKQCKFFRDDFPRGAAGRLPGECPVCGLGRRDWYFEDHNFTLDNPGHDRVCKRCGHRIRVKTREDRESFPTFCPECMHGRSEPNMTAGAYVAIRTEAPSSRWGRTTVTH